jgi:hypothetical protein
MRSSTVAAKALASESLKGIVAILTPKELVRVGFNG